VTSRPLLCCPQRPWLRRLYQWGDHAVTFYKKSILPGGLRVVTEEIPHVRSVSVGIWVGAGSCWEEETSQGVSHFIEHLLFKGTQSRTARQIAQAVEGLGGHLNAFTSKEHTCYYARVLDDHFPIAVDVLADMLAHSLFDPIEIAKERGVIVEEIRMYEDVPDDVVHDLFAHALWKGHPFGRPVVGSEATVSGLSREDLLRFMGEHYTPDNMVIAVAGNVSHDAVLEAIAEKFAPITGNRSPGLVFPEPPPEPVGPVAVVRRKETEQVHFVLGMRGLHQDHRDVYALQVLNAILGGGASSRLFQEIREARGLAYSVYSYPWMMRNSGAFGIYAGVSPANMEQVLSLVQAELVRMGTDGVTEEELLEAKEQLKGQIMLSLESTSNRMNRLGRGELARGEVHSPDEIIGRVDRVTLEQVRELAQWQFLGPPRILSVVGPVPDSLNLSPAGFETVVTA
jgi:predicted Zn-dependent peptidase